jgi:ATP-dependent helicase HrpA
VNSVAAFNHWRVEAERTNARLLYMSRADLTQRDAEEAGTGRFPDHWPIGGNLLPLEYKFEPAESADGVTLVVPELLLDVVNAEQIAWLVPGMRLEKIVALFRALPKAQRKLLVPVPDFAKAALDDVAVAADRLGRLPPFHEWLAQWITQRVGSTVTPLELTALPLPDFLRMNLRVLDADDLVLAEGRDLLAIKRKLYAVAPPVSTGVTGVSPRAATPPRAVTSSRRPNEGVLAAGARGAGAVSGTQSVGAQSGAGQDAESMASLLASAWGVSGPTSNAQAGSRGSADSASGAQVRVGAKGGIAAVAGTREGMTAGVKLAGSVGSTGATSGSFSRGGAVLASWAAAGAPLHRQWDFGDVPEHREVERNRLRLVVYPAVEDRVTGVALVEARNAPAAEAISRAGIVRLAMLALPQQAKYVSKRVTDDRDLILLSRGLSLRQSLADALTQRTFRECFLPEDVPLPRTAQDFTKVLDGRRAQLSEVADRLASSVRSTLKEWRAARATLDGLRTGSFADVVAEVNAQLGLLLAPDFIESTPRPWLDYLPRYLKAINRRIERLPPNVRRDAELSAKVRPFTTALRTFMAEPVISGVRPELEELRWMIEEFRVSLFAQELKTMVRVSEKRLEDQVRVVRESQR